VRVHHTLDEVGVAGTATARADREPPGELRLDGSGERGRLLVVHMDPVDPALGRTTAAADGVAESVQAVADQAVDPLDPGLNQQLNQVVRHRTRHGNPLVGSDRLIRVCFGPQRAA
jgi:hypothetical protein